MKTIKSPETEITPSKKKLKQAILPFKLLGDDIPATERTQTRKRKLSAPETEPIIKVGKITRENDTAHDLVVLSDEDSGEGQRIQNTDKTPNPFVKLVDSAWKKKLQRTKSSKKKKNATKGNSPGLNKNSDEVDKNDGALCMNVDNVENGDVDITRNKSTFNDEDKNINGSQLETSNTINMEVSNLPSNRKLKDEDETQSQRSDKKCGENIKKNISSNIVNNKTLNEVLCSSSQNSNESETIKTHFNESLTSVCDESNSSITTPKQNTRNASVSSDNDVSLNNSNILTPKRQSQKRLDTEKKKEEREKEKQEREKKRQQEKEERARHKQEKEEQKKKEREEKEEVKRKEKEEKEEQRRKEKEEKERQKELDKKLREEKEKLKKKEKEEKEEMRRKGKEAKEEEKRKKQEALELERQEQEQKKKKAAVAFVNFFVPKQKNEKDQHTIGPVSKNNLLSSFTIKADMRLAPTTRIYITDEHKQALDNSLKEQNTMMNALYVQNLKERKSKPMTNGKTWPLNEKDDDVVIVEDDLPPIDDAGEILSYEPIICEKLRPKLLSFHDNRRPPYWGTWRKRSEFVKPRRPFHQDQKLLDYEVDSDEEWEEEQEGESIDGSAVGSDDEPDADEYEVDNEVFVPHGYLSDEEATVDEDDVLSLSPETQKARLKYLEHEFEYELKKPTEKLKPRMYGLLWETSDGEKPEKCVDTLWNYFKQLSMVLNDPSPLLQPSSEPDEMERKKIKKKKYSPDADTTPLSTEKNKKTKHDNKESKKIKTDAKKNVLETKKSQPGINTFLTKLKSP